MERANDCGGAPICQLVRAGVLVGPLVAIALFAGCGGSTSARQVGDDAVAMTVMNGTADSTLQAADVEVCGAPLRVVVQQDKTGSVAENRTPQIHVADLEPLIAQVVRCGGELALGIIDNQSNSVLARLYVPEPGMPPSRPEQRGTPFQLVQARARYESQRTDYDLTAQRHQADAQRQAQLFRAEAAELLSVPHDASRTDVWGAVARSGYFLGEPGTWQRNPRLIAAVVSDVVDNVGRQPVRFPEGAELYLINGAPCLGALTDLNPVRFESFDAAVRYILGSKGRS
jgi:hypothetical protein